MIKRMLLIFLTIQRIYTERKRYSSGNYIFDNEIPATSLPSNENKSNTNIIKT